MLGIRYARTLHTRARILHEVGQNKKLIQDYSVVDVGGALGGGWTASISDLVIDINAVTSPSGVSIDVCDREAWNTMREYVERHGLFDYAICTHTLEDLYNPFTTLELLPRIAKAGIITMPSLRTELCRIESAKWLGYIHHRWMFTERNGAMLVVPKLSMLEHLVDNHIVYDKEQEEIVYEWTEDIPYQSFMNNYLGPDAQTVIAEFHELIKNL